jgi:hypothetical protein
MFAGWWAVYLLYHLFDRYNRLEIERLRVGAAVKEAELRALKSQVNPHFLFNSLNSLRALIDEDAPRARSRSRASRTCSATRCKAVSRNRALRRRAARRRGLPRPGADPPREPPARPLGNIPGDTARPATCRPCSCRPWSRTPSNTASPPAGRAAKWPSSAHCEARRAEHPRDQSRRLRPDQRGAARAGSSTGVGLRNAAERLKLLFGERATLILRARAGRTASPPTPSIPLPPTPMKALLIDDERLARNELRRLLAAHAEIEIVGEAVDAEDARAKSPRSARPPVPRCADARGRRIQPAGVSSRRRCRW